MDAYLELTKKPGFYVDRPNSYEEMSAMQRVSWSDALQAWLITDRELIQEFLKSSKMSVRRKMTTVDRLPEGVRGKYASLKDFYENWILFNDASTHRKMRAAVTRSFSAPAIQSKKAIIHQSCVKLSRAAKEKFSSHFDFVTEIAQPLAAEILIEHMELNVISSAEASHMATKFFDYLIDRTPTIDKSDEVLDCLNVLHERLDEAIFLGHSELKQLTNEFGHTVGKDIYASILIDGISPLSSLIVHTLDFCLENWNKVSPESAIPTRVVEEIGRIRSPFQYVARYATEDLAIDDCSVAAGERVMMLIGMANNYKESKRDEISVCPHRDFHGNLMYGHGPHRCLGMALATISAGECIPILKTNFPDLTLKEAKIKNVFAVNDYSQYLVENI